jgi:hypothetical protein
MTIAPIPCPDCHGVGIRVVEIAGWWYCQMCKGTRRVLVVINDHKDEA